MKKKIGVLWPAGLDSTYIVVDNLRKGNNVSPLYVDILNNQEKAPREKKHIHEMFGILKVQYLPLLELPHENVIIDIRGWNDNLSFKQIPLFIVGLLYNNNHFDEIHMGYVMNDDAIPYIDDIRKVYQSYQPFMKDKLPELVFPLIKMKKSTIWDELPGNIRQLTVFCENPKGDSDCGDCDSCKRYVYEELYFKYERNQTIVKNMGSIPPDTLSDEEKYRNLDVIDGGPPLLHGVPVKRLETLSLSTDDSSS